LISANGKKIDTAVSGIMIKKRYSGGTINTDARTLSDTGFHFGSQDAPAKLTVITNLACPDCAAFVQNYDTELLPAIKSNQLELILKPFDKPKVGLLKGNLVHLFLNYQDQETTNPITCNCSRTNRNGKRSPTMKSKPT
jgi:hypothetical protein